MTFSTEIKGGNDEAKYDSLRLTVVIPTWNRWALLEECLQSLRKQTFEAFEVIVVDDGSTDDTAAAVKRDFPEVRFIRLEMNGGFAKAVNVGIREARLELVMLLNNDMTLDKHCISELVEGADESAAAMFAPLVLFKDDPDVIYSAGDRLLANGRPESVGFRIPIEDFSEPGRIFGVSAGAALYRRALFDEIGLFDEGFVAYFEDADLCARARLAGLEASFVGEAVAYHVGSASIEERLWWRTRQCYRNYHLLVVKNMPASVLLHHLGAIALESWRGMGRVVSAARCEFGLARSLWILIKTVGSIKLAFIGAVVQRWKIQRGRALTGREFEALLDEEPDA